MGTDYPVGFGHPGEGCGSVAGMVYDPLVQDSWRVYR